MRPSVVACILYVQIHEGMFADDVAPLFRNDPDLVVDLRAAAGSVGSESAPATLPQRRQPAVCRRLKMTQVYFHCSNTSEVLIDRCGAVVDDLAEARDRAASVVRSLTTARNLE